MDELTILLKKASGRLTYIEPEQDTDLNEFPTQEQKDNLLFRIEQSQTSEELEKYVRMNLDAIKLDEYRSIYNKITDQTPTIDPRKQWSNFIYSQSNPTFF